MSYTSDNWRAAITKLLKQTSRKEISWVFSDMKQIDAWTEVDRSFECEIKGKIYVVCQTRKKYFLDEDEWVWNGGFYFGVYVKNFDGYNLLGSAPDEMSIIGSLYTAAEASFAYSSGALKDLLD